MVTATVGTAADEVEPAETNTWKGQA